MKTNKNVVIKKVCHSRGMLSEMTPNLTGFTLIELLVVVLIIGILAAVAVPQYRLAVAKARWAEGISNLRTFKQAAQLAFLENGVYPSDWNLLDISIGTIDSTYNYLVHSENFTYKINSNEGILAIDSPCYSHSPCQQSVKMNVVWDRKYNFFYCKIISADSISSALCNQWSHNCEEPVTTTNSGSPNCGTFRCCKIKAF